MPPRKTNPKTSPLVPQASDPSQLTEAERNREAALNGEPAAPSEPKSFDEIIIPMLVGLVRMKDDQIRREEIIKDIFNILVSTGNWQ